MKTIDVNKMNNLFTYVNKCVHNKEAINLDRVLTLDKNIEAQLALCLKVLCSYKNRPSVITERNCDLWWNVIIHTNNDLSSGSMYGYSKKTCVRVCKLISKYLFWFIAHLNCEVLWIHSNLKNILALTFNKIYNKKDILYTFRKAKQVKDISFISKEDWTNLLFQTGIYSYNGAIQLVNKKSLKEKTSIKDKPLVEITNFRALVYS